MRVLWMLGVVLGAGCASAPSVSGPVDVAATPPEPPVAATPPPSTPALSPKIDLGAGVVDLAQFSDVRAVIADFAGKPAYAFARGDVVIPLVATDIAAPAGFCTTMLGVRALWIFGDGAAFSPTDGILLVPSTKDDNVRCWRRIPIAKMTTFKRTAIADDSREASRLTLKLARGNRTHVAKLTTSDDAVLRLDGRQLASAGDTLRPLFSETPALSMAFEAGTYADAREVLAIDLYGSDMLCSVAMEWQGAAAASHLVAWRVEVESDEVESWRAYLKASQLPLASGAVLDGEARFTERSETQHIGTVFDIERSVTLSIARNGVRIPLWPERDPAAKAVQKSGPLPWSLPVGGCSIELDGQTNMVVSCGVGSTKEGGPYVGDDPEMSVTAKDHGPFIEVHWVDESGVGGQFDRTYFVSKKGDKAIVVRADDIEQ